MSAGLNDPIYMIFSLECKFYHGKSAKKHVLIPRNAFFTGGPPLNRDWASFGLVLSGNWAGFFVKTWQPCATVFTCLAKSVHKQLISCLCITSIGESIIISKFKIKNTQICLKKYYHNLQFFQNCATFFSEEHKRRYFEECWSVNNNSSH